MRNYADVVLPAAAVVAAAGAALVLARRRRAGAAPSPPQPSSSPPEVSVKTCEHADELFAICRLRFMVYVGELKRSNYSYVDNIREILEDPLDHAEGTVNLFIAHPSQDLDAWRKFLTRHSQAADGGAAVAHPDVGTASAAGEDAGAFVPAVGCVRVHVPMPAKYASLFSIHDAAIWGDAFAGDASAFAFFSRFMVHATHRGKAYGYTDALYGAAAVAARRRGARFLLLNCTPALLSLIHISEPTRLLSISYAVFCLKKKKIK